MLLVLRELKRSCVSRGGGDGTKRISGFIPFSQPKRYYGHRHTQVMDKGTVVIRVSPEGQGTQESRYQEGCVSQRLTDGRGWEKVAEKMQREEEEPSSPFYR